MPDRKDERLVMERVDLPDVTPHDFLKRFQELQIPESTRLHVTIEEVKEDMEQMIESQQQAQKSKWAKVSEEIQKDPPLSGAGGHVLEASKEFREGFNLGDDK